MDDTIKEERRKTVNELLGHIGQTMEHLKQERGAKVAAMRWHDDERLYFDLVGEGGILIACYTCAGHTDGMEFMEVELPQQPLIT